MPLISILETKLILQEKYHCNEFAIDLWPYWMFEEYIKIINRLAEKEEQQRKRQEKDQQKNMPSMNTSSLMNSFSSMANKFK